VASRVGDFIDRITPQSNGKTGGSMMVGHMKLNDRDFASGSQILLSKN